tara:strand:+ start:2271 stop:6359 length:4089 start_codon:yes stop_codon:yes gene_type:complete
MAKINLGGGSKVGTIQSVLSGIGAGLIDIPKGAFSLGAALVDLGAGTNNAAKVENWFDDLTTLDEAAEATTAGKITRIIANLGVPGTVAFKAGSRLASKAINSKKNNTFFHITKDMDDKLQKTLNAKGKMLTTLGGVGGVGVSDAIFVGDAQQVGTLGDAFNFGPTQLSNDANNSSALIMNRIRFGADSAMIGSIIGGTGNAIGQAVKRSGQLKRNNDFIDKILDYTLPQGRQTKEGFEISRGFKGIRSADVDKVQRIQRQTDKLIDANYGILAKLTGWGVMKERNAVTQSVHEALVSTSKKAGPTVEDVFDDAGELIGGKFNLGDMDPKALDKIKQLKVNNKSIDADGIIENLIKTRRVMEGSFSAIGENMIKYGSASTDDLLGAWSQYKNAFLTKTQDWMNGTYRIFPNSSAEALKGFKPSQEALENTTELYKQASYKIEYNKAIAAGKTPAEAATAAGNVNHNNVALLAVDQLLKGSKGGKFITEGVSSPYLYDEDGLLFGTVARKDIDVIVDRDYYKGMEDIALKGKSAVGDLADGTKARIPLNTILDEPVEGISVKGLTPKKILEDVLGKVEDPAVTMLTKVNQLSIIRRSHEYFNDLSTILGAKVVKNADGTEKLKGQIFDTKADAVAVFGIDNVDDAISMSQKTGPGGSLYVDALNPLEGKFTSKGMKEAIEGTRKGLLDWTQEGGLGAALYTNLILYPKATAQLAKTVLSPITHARNIISAGAFAAANGVIPLMNTEARAEALKTIGNISTLGTEEGAKRLRELQRLGVINKSARLGDVEELLADSNFGGWAGQQRVLEAILRPAKKFKEVSTDAYQTEDDFWKVFTFTAERQRIEKALTNSGIDVQVFAKDARNDLGRVFDDADSYLDEAAASIVRNNVPNYDYVNNMVKEIRRLPLGNFVSFPAEIMRTSVNILKKGFAENNYSYNGVKPFKSIGLQRLLGFGATTVAVPFGTVEAFKLMYDVSGMEMDALRRFVPDWSKNSTIVPIKEDDGTFKYVDFSHANAYDTMIRPFQTVMNAVADGRTDTDTVMEDVVQGVFQSTKELGQPFISESLWTASLGDIFLREGQTRDGKRLYTDQTPTGDKVAKIVEHLANSQLPGGVNIKDGNITGSYIRFKNAITKNPDTYGRTYELSDEALGIAGMRAVAIDPVASMKYKIADFTRGVSNARREFTSPLLKGGPVSAEEIVDRYKTANEALFQVQKNMSQDYFGALVLGADDRALNREFKDRISKVQMGNLKRGKFKPFLPSENIQASFAANAKKINAPNTYLEAKAVINEMARQLNKVRLFDDTFPQLTNPFSGQNSFLPTAGLSSTLPNLNLGLTTPASNTNVAGNTAIKGQQVFGSNDPIFGG